MSTFQRVVTVIDADAAKVPTWPCQDGDTLLLFALSATSLATLSLRIFGFSSLGMLAAISPEFVFAAAATADYAGQFSGTPNLAVWMPIDGINFGAVKVDAITGGPWLICATVSAAKKCPG